jgi:histidinol-phosphate phosphatase family protein
VSPGYDIVVPTAGRPSLRRLLDALAAADGPGPGRIVLVDDRPAGAPGGLAGSVPGALRPVTCIVRGDGRGPAAARNRGWRACRAPWIAFLDDDVVPGASWPADLAGDLAAAGARVAGVQGGIRVPLPAGRRPTDWERNVAGLESARWATADLAYRRVALEQVGGFDERFPRAYREDTDIGLRLAEAGWSITGGARSVEHPVGPASWRVSLDKQAGNADDALMDAVHGRGWRTRGGAPRGRRRRHVATTAAVAAAAGLAAAGRPRAAAVAGAAWLAGTAELTWIRAAPGPRTPRELATVTATSALLPVAATGWWLRGLPRARRLARAGRPALPGRPAAVLFDRDDTLVLDVPYNGDPERVQPVPGAREALDRLRAAGVAIGVVSNQSGVARGLLTAAQVKAVNRRAEALLGPIGTWQWCPHAPGDGCDCRKPAPGLVLRAAAALGVDPRDCAVVGDIGADVGAALAAGARAVLVPTARTRREEVEAAPQLAPDLEAAVDLLLGAPPAGARRIDVPEALAA